MNPKSPDFVCIGAQKAGTTWLYSQLEGHPDIWVPPIKELHFFDYWFLPDTKRWVSGHINKSIQRSLRNHISQSKQIDLQYIHYLSGLANENVLTEEWYKRVFSWIEAKKKAAGELTPAYSALPEGGVSYAREFLGDVKIIYLIRDPVSRALSQAKMMMSRHNFDPKSRDDWLQVLQHPNLQDRGDYDRAIPLWRRFFGDERILFIPYGQISEEPNEVLRKLEDFLGINNRQIYEKSKERVHVGPDIDVPKDILQLLRKQNAHQLGAIKRELGEEFAEWC